ncbi:MAG TPA: MerC domain-containing protein [Candidatus Obscuribacterales bacterium]
MTDDLREHMSTMESHGATRKGCCGNSDGVVAPPDINVTAHQVKAESVVAHAAIRQDHHSHEESAESKAIVSLDNLGILASTLCLIHCLAMPFLIAALPFLGWQFLEGETAHRVLATLIFAFAIFAIVPGYLKHRRRDILISMLLGLSAVAFAIFGAGPLMGESAELPFITLGNLILVATHWRNRGLCKCAH